MKITPATTYVTVAERVLMRQWKREGKSKSEIMRLTGRSKNAVNLQLKRMPKSVGRKKIIAPLDFRKLKGHMNKLLRKAKAEKEVTIEMVKSASKIKACKRTILDAFHEDGFYFRPLRKKPILTKLDISKRLRFHHEFKSRSAKTWEKKPNATIDNKQYQMLRNAKARAEGARRQVRGAYRPHGEGPKPWMVKANPTMKFPAKTVQVTAAVIKGKIRVWRYVDGRWGAKEAVKMYKGPLLTALKKSYPEQKTFSVMEDNDPAGYKCKAALAAKVSVGIKTVSLPPRSPDLNVLDYSLWHSINTAMRAQEARMDAKKYESVAEFKARLRRVAMSLPKKTVSKAVRDMRRRVQLLATAKPPGGLFMEAK